MRRSFINEFGDFLFKYIRDRNVLPRKSGRKEKFNHYSDDWIICDEVMKKNALLVLLIFAFFLQSACNQIKIEDKTPAYEDAENPNNANNDIKLEAPYNTKYLDFVTVDEGYAITDHVEYSGSEYQYVVYGLENLNEATAYSRDIYWIIIVLKNDEVFTVLRQDLDEYAGPIPTSSELVLEADVDFDGVNDVLLWLGHFGNQGLTRYTCYLSRDNKLVKCPSFSEIANPAVDAENCVILSSWRNWAASHSYAMYYFIDGEYIEKERLTEEPVQTEKDKELWSWTDEVFIDGTWQIREYFTEEDYDPEILYNEKVYGEGCHWDIGQERWRTLFNNGMMSDFSIYGSEYIEIE